MNRPRMHLREGAHKSVIRSAAIWTPIFIASTALGVAFALIALDSPGAWVSFAIAALIALLSGVSALGALRDIYAEPVCVEFVSKLRNQETFQSVEELVHQINRDVADSRQVLTQDRGDQVA